jgi:hypothetical protein
LDGDLNHRRADWARQSRSNLDWQPNGHLGRVWRQLRREHWGQILWTVIGHTNALSDSFAWHTNSIPDPFSYSSAWHPYPNTYTTDRDANTNGRSLRHAGNDPDLWKHLNAPARGNR